METNKIKFLETYLSFYINHTVIMDNFYTPDSKYVVLDVRNAPAQIKKRSNKRSCCFTG